MPIENRKVKCDICAREETETLMGAGWPGWVLINGIGAVAPIEGESISNKNLEMYVCPFHKTELAIYLDKMQLLHKGE